MLALLLALGGLFPHGAGADETLCRAELKLRDGSKATLTEAAVLESGATTFRTRDLPVRTGEEIRGVVLNRLRSLKRLGPSKEIERDTYYEFSYKDDEGKAGTFWLMGETEFVGNSALGPVSITVRDVESITLNCPPPIKTDGQPPDMQ